MKRPSLGDGVNYEVIVRGHFDKLSLEGTAEVKEFSQCLQSREELFAFVKTKGDDFID